MYQANMVYYTNSFQSKKISRLGMFYRKSGRKSTVFTEVKQQLLWQPDDILVICHSGASSALVQEFGDALEKLARHREISLLATNRRMS